MMAKVDLSNFWGSGIDMSGFTDDGWGYVYSGNPTGTLYAGYNSITFNAYGFAQFDSVTVNYYYDGQNYVFVEDVLYYEGSALVQTLADVNIETTVTDLNYSTWYVRFNQGNDEFLGNDYADYIKGGWGNDVLVGYSGNDQLFGNDGDDTLSGGSGSDLIAGGFGYDTAVFAGFSSDYIFARNLDGSISVTDIYGSGTDYLYNVEAASFSNGTFVADSLIPVIVPPSDPYVGDSSGNALVGDSGSNRLKGFGGNDTIKGGGGADYLYGGSGNDILSGGTGKDHFVFDVKANRSTNCDKITDFRASDDTIRLDNAVFTKVGSNGALKAGAFYASMTGKAHDSSDRILYEKDTGKLFYDADGTGKIAAVQFATLTNKAAVTVKDFDVI
jgi:Ca2+-binding RTX toxin-like protein